MSDLAYEIEQLYIEGHTPRMIAIMLECPIEQVLGWLEQENLVPEDHSPYATVNS
jgi:hypothetical protein